MQEAAPHGPNHSWLPALRAGPDSAPGQPWQGKSEAIEDRQERGITTGLSKTTPAGPHASRNNSNRAAWDPACPTSADCRPSAWSKGLAKM